MMLPSKELLFCVDWWRETWLANNRIYTHWPCSDWPGFNTKVALPTCLNTKIIQQMQKIATVKSDNTMDVRKNFSFIYRYLILVATSGDTGGAVLDGFRRHSGTY